jgi:hypothetical protein
MKARTLFTLSAILAAAVFLPSCKRELQLTPPAGARIISFTQNTHVKNRAIYQGQGEAAFKAGETSHVFWGGVTTPGPSHRLHARLLGNTQDIYFTLTFTKSGKKVFSTAMKEKEIMGCAIPTQELKENEFTIEVMAPQGLKLAKEPEYRVFVGIEGDKPLKFYSGNAGK